jgi:D-amino-acid dehydrogenase
MTDSASTKLDHVVVVGAGLLGFSTAWFLQERDVGVGPRPVTADGLPLIGASANPRVFVAGGHGMWGIALGPATGRLLAEQIVTGARPRALRAFSPLR